jgi:hypothetical protein
VAAKPLLTRTGLDWSHLYKRTIEALGTHHDGNSVNGHL